MNTGSGEQWDLYPGETAGKHKIKIKMIKVWNIKVPSHQEGREKRAARGEEGGGGGEKTGRGRGKAQPEARRRSDAFTSLWSELECVNAPVCVRVFDAASSFSFLLVYQRNIPLIFTTTCFGRCRSCFLRIFIKSQRAPDDVIVMSSRLRWRSDRTWTDRCVRHPNKKQRNDTNKCDGGNSLVEKLCKISLVRFVGFVIHFFCQETFFWNLLGSYWSVDRSICYPIYILT